MVDSLKGTFSSNDLILVTGANGFLASWIITYALSAGARVRGTVRDFASQEELKLLPGGAKERLEIIFLDLTHSSASEFDACVSGCTLVVHVASPFPPVMPENENELILPAREGTLSLLQACMMRSSVVKRVVLTSSIAAMHSLEGREGKQHNETDWTPLHNTLSAYAKSKVLAEQAAWAFYHTHGPKWTLCTMNPGLVLGPALFASHAMRSTSLNTLRRLMNSSSVFVPRLSFGVVDVRDVARAHIYSLCTAKEIQGRRFILCQSTKWMVEMCKELQCCKWEGPDWFFYAASWWDASIRFLLPQLGVYREYDSSPSQDVLGIDYMPFEKTIKDSVNSLVFHGIWSDGGGTSCLFWDDSL